MIALVIGGGRYVKREMDQAFKMFNPDIVVAINDIGATIERLDHWVTLHPGQWPNFLAARRSNRFHMNFQRWSTDVEDANLDCEEPPLAIWPDYKPSGLSGLYAVKIALHCGADKIVLAGVPMDLSGHYSGNRKKHWIRLKRRTGWETQYKDLANSVRSMSGWTMDTFGEPTPEWLASKELVE